MDQSKRCSRCRIVKPVSEFGPSKQTPDGLFRYCRGCKRASDRRSYAANRAARQPARRAYYEANREDYLRRAKERYRRDPDAVKEQARQWAADHPDRRREIVRKSQDKAYALDPERKREAWRRRHAAIRRGCAVYRFTSEQLAAKVAYWGGRCWVCSGSFQAIDHVKPLAKGGPHMLANLRPICTPCNTRKRDTWPLSA